MLVREDVLEQSSYLLGRGAGRERKEGKETLRSPKYTQRHRDACGVVVEGFGDPGVSCVSPAGQLISRRKRIEVASNRLFEQRLSMVREISRSKARPREMEKG